MIPETKDIDNRQAIEDILNGRVYPELVLWGYRQGIFPMADPKTDTIEWFYPAWRGIIDLDRFVIPRTLRSRIRQGRFRLTIDKAFEQVIRACARREQTWINDTIVNCYCRLHRAGYAHSVECWYENDLAGGLYGVALGGAFFGESMFHVQTDASKIALVGLVQHLRRQHFSLLDIQWLTDHLARFGGSQIDHAQYLLQLTHALQTRCDFVRPDQQTLHIDI